MDVIVAPSGSSGSSWVLKDRLGRPLGTIEALDDGYTPFTISPEGALVGVGTQHASLDAAMSAIARKMGGACELDSEDWK